MAEVDFPTGSGPSTGGSGVTDVLGSTNIDVTGTTTKTVALVGPISATLIADGSVSNAEFQTLDGISTATPLVTQLAGKLATNGDGSALSNLNASALATGTTADARLSANVDLLNTAQTFTARKTFPAAGANAAQIPAILGGATNTNGHVVPNVADDTFALLAATQTLTSKTLTAPVLSGTLTGTYTIGGTPTFPANVVLTTGSQTLSSKTLTAPILSGSVTGTYTLAGTPTITAPAISSPVFSGSATGTYTLAGTPTITSPAISGPTLSGTLAGTYTIGGTPTFPASVLLTSGSQTVSGQKTFPSAGSSAVVIPAVRQVSAGNDITVPTASGADSFALLAQTQTLTNKTLTSPTISSPAFSGTSTGTFTLGGNVTLGPTALLGGNLNAFNYTITSLANPTPGSTEAATAQYVDVRAASIITLAIFGNGPSTVSWNANTYIGINSSAGGAANPGAPNGPAQWIAPCNGTLKQFRFFSGGATSGSNITFTVYQNGSATAATLPLTAGNTTATSSFSSFIFAGDFFCLKTDTTFATGAPGGFSFTAVFIPSL